MTFARLEIYSYWNQGGQENVLSMFLTLGDRYLLPPGTAPAPGEIMETPILGLTHPLSSRYFSTPKEYLTWYEGEQTKQTKNEEGSYAGPVGGAVKAGVKAGPNRGHKVAPPGSPRVAVLLYRKHVITRQGYIAQMIRCEYVAAGGWRGGGRRGDGVGAGVGVELELDGWCGFFCAMSECWDIYILVELAC